MPRRNRLDKSGMPLPGEPIAECEALRTSHGWGSPPRRVFTTGSEKAGAAGFTAGIRFRYHSMAIAAVVRPAPTELRISLSPGLSDCSTSSMARGMLALDVFPNRSTLR